MITWVDGGKCAFYQFRAQKSRKKISQTQLIFGSNALLVYKNGFQFHFDFQFRFAFHFQNQIHLEKVLAASENL
jgi:hypothetical protein